MLSAPPDINVLSVLAKIFSKKETFFRSVLFHMKIRACLKYFLNDYKFNGIFSRGNLPRIKCRAKVVNFDKKKAEEPIGFHQILTKIKLCTLILSELNIFLKKY